MEQGLERFRSAGPISRAVQRNCQKISGPVLCRKQFNRFAKRQYGRGVLLLIQKQHAEIEIRFGHFWVDSDGACVFGPGFVSSLQCRVDVGELKVRVSELRLVSDNSLQWRDRRLKIALIDVALGFLQQIV